ncbi:MAG: ribonuclease domain-containing protein [Rhodanobacter sp.]
MRLIKLLIVLAFIALVAVAWQQHTDRSSVAVTANPTAQGQPPNSDSAEDNLPSAARATLQRIARGGPFEHDQDGVVFGNYESLLPKRPRGYYHEYTVETPGARTRGARRIVTGGTPPVVWYYTDDHYRSFRPVEGPR